MSVATAFPGIVDVDVNVTRRLHSVGSHGIGHPANVFRCHSTGEFVPTVPAHGRSANQAIVGHLVEFGRLDAGRHGPLAVRRGMGHHFTQRRVRAVARTDMQLIAGEFTFVAHLSFVVAIHHAPG